MLMLARTSWKDGMEGWQCKRQGKDGQLWSCVLCPVSCQNLDNLPKLGRNSQPRVFHSAPTPGLEPVPVPEVILLQSVPWRRRAALASDTQETVLQNNNSNNRNNTIELP